MKYKKVYLFTVLVALLLILPLILYNNLKAEESEYPPFGDNNPIEFRVSNDIDTTKYPLNKKVFQIFDEGVFDYSEKVSELSDDELLLFQFDMSEIYEEKYKKLLSYKVIFYNINNPDNILTEIYYRDYFVTISEDPRLYLSFYIKKGLLKNDYKNLRAKEVKTNLEISDEEVNRLKNIIDSFKNIEKYVDDLETKLSSSESENRKEVIKQLKNFYEMFYILISHNKSDIIIHIDKDFEKEFSIPKKELSKEEYEEILSVISETETIFSIKNEDEKSKEIKEKTTKIYDLEEKVKNKENELNLKNTRISSLEQDLETKNLEIHSKAGELSRLNNLISTKDNELNNKSEKIALLENEIISLKANAAASESTDNIENTNTEETTNKENKNKKENEIMFYSAYALVGVVGVVGITIILKIIFTLLRKPRRYRY